MKKGNKNRRNTPKKISYNSENQMMTLFKIIIVLIVIFGVFYGLTLWRTRDKALDDTDVKETEIQYDEILVGTLLKQNANEYYVLYADLNAVDYSKYKAYIDLLGENPDIKLYTIDKENVFNRSYIGNDSNVENYVGKSSIDGIIFNEDCLMHIKKVKNKKGVKENKLTEVFAGDEEILKKFSKMVETK